MKSGVNGCGCGSGILKYFKPPYARYFINCCNSHDAAYDIGGTEENRKHADVWLFWRMVGNINIRYFSPFKATWLVLISLLYYISVRLFGRKFFNYK